MKQVTISAVNGITVTPNVTMAIDIQKIIRYHQNTAGFAVVRYNSNTNTTQPESLTLTINKATVDALIATDATISLITANVYDTTSGVLTATSFNTDFLVTLKDSYFNIRGTKTAVVSFEYSDGGFKNKIAYISSTLAALVASNKAEILTYRFAAVAGSTTAINATARTIAATVPFGTNVTAMVATFTKSPNLTSIKVGGVAQTSGATANNFSTAKTYVLVAADAITTRNWVVTVTVRAATTTTTTGA